jgi:fermentation-respiration switch protein FrsA (DUF1100 family)
MTPSMRERYARAARLTGPRAAWRRPSSALEGCWLDADRYAFIDERLSHDRETLIPTPAVADLKSGRIEPLLAEGELPKLLGDALGRRLRPHEMGLAVLRFSRGDVLGVELPDAELLIHLPTRRAEAVHRGRPERALYSPDGRYAVLVRGHDLWIRELASGGERPLFDGGEPRWAYGRQSETSRVTLADRADPMPLGLWSPDSAWFLTHRIDERALPEMPIVQSALPGVHPPVAHLVKYATPADPVPLATFVAVELSSGRRVVFDEQPFPVAFDTPFARRMCWFGSASAAWALRQDRFARTTELVRFDLSGGEASVVVREAAGCGFLEFASGPSRPPNVRTLDESGEVIWISERDGHARLYLHGPGGEHPITPEGVTIRDIVDVQDGQGPVLVLASGVERSADPARRCLCSVQLDGSGFRVLAAHDGDVAVPIPDPSGPPQICRFAAAGPSGVSPDGRKVVLREGSPGKGDRTRLMDLDTGASLALATRPPEAGRVEEVVVRAADGRTQLHGVLFLPSDFAPSGRYPLVDFIYPGPQMAHRPQTHGSPAAAPARALAELGLAVLMLDTRGTAVGDRARRQASYGRLLEPQLADHAAAVRQLCAERAWLDASRVGVLGQSAGGAAAFRALCDYGEVFRVGVSICGNHDSDLLSAAWSDKYRGPRPKGGWRYPPNPAVAARLAGELLLVHGDLDETVHVSQTLRLVDALIAANRDFQLLVVPNAGHDVFMTNGYAQRRVWDFFVRHLLGRRPPSSFELRFESHELARLAIVAKRESRL